MNACSSPTGASFPLLPSRIHSAAAATLNATTARPAAIASSGHVAERFGEAREQEQVGAGIVNRERFPAQHAGEMHRRIFGRELRAQRTIADHHHARVRMQIAYVQERAQGKRDIFFRCKRPT